MLYYFYLFGMFSVNESDLHPFVVKTGALGLYKVVSNGKVRPMPSLLGIRTVLFGS